MQLFIGFVSYKGYFPILADLQAIRTQLCVSLTFALLGWLEEAPGYFDGLYYGNWVA